MNKESIQAPQPLADCRRALVDRFGIDGSSRLEELYEEILEEVSSSGATTEAPKDDEASWR